MIRLTDPAAVAPALTQMRTARDAPRRDVAFAVGMLPQQYGQYEMGQRVPSVVTLIRLAAALGYDLALIPREDA